MSAANKNICKAGLDGRIPSTAGAAKFNLHQLGLDINN
jgi:hypothetical protein